MSPAQSTVVFLKLVVEHAATVLLVLLVLLPAGEVAAAL
jgi:hypothetical protein